MFYKIYFGLLEYTNQNYRIIPNMKIYNQQGLNPEKIVKIVEKFWENKQNIITSFKLNNPVQYDKKELELVDGFAKGFRDTFILADYSESHALFLGKQKIYMVKGLNSNIDKVIQAERLPVVFTTSIIQFNNDIVYDGIILEMPINGSQGIKIPRKTDFKFFKF